MRNNYYYWVTSQLLNKDASTKQKVWYKTRKDNLGSLERKKILDTKKNSYK